MIEQLIEWVPHNLSQMEDVGAALLIILVLIVIFRIKFKRPVK